MIMRDGHILSFFRQSDNLTMPKVRRTIRSPDVGKEDGL